MKKRRLDEILIAKGWVKDKNEAFVVVTEGRVFAEGQKAISPAQVLNPGARIEMRSGEDFVGRGAYKLAAALEKFKINVENKICADIGAATGGFTQVLLRHGASKVYAIDTAKGKFAFKLRENPKVALMEKTDVRDVKELSDPVFLATIDISLIPLEDILPHIKRLLSREGVVVALFKPQYQTRDPKLLKHGIIRDSVERGRLLENFLQWAEEQGWKILGQMESPIRGSEGNVEYLVWLR
jgi:23S rRNA (cytidine1920-2'-O)/16S rRNA (cytidine1409-2'-O)-methyltransferase